MPEWSKAAQVKDGADYHRPLPELVEHGVRDANGSAGQRLGQPIRWEVRKGALADRELRKPKESGFFWAGVTEEFYLQVKGWPVDVDLSDKLKDGRIAGMPIDAKLVQAVLNLVASGGVNSSFVYTHLAEEAEGAVGIATGLFTPKPRIFELLECSSEDAKRALNLFDWWQGKHPKTPQLLLLRPLVRALQRGGLHNELEAVWKTYKIGSLVYKHPSHILHRLVSALTFLARKDEVGVIASELIQVDQPIFDNNSVVLTLASLIEAGFETEAQRLADLQFEKHGVRLDVALESKISQKHTDCLGGVKSYELLLKLEGPHRASLPVQAALILHCYFPIKQTDKMWEAYQLGKGFDGNFDTTVMRYMLYELTAADRIANAEEVLEDYYRIRRDSRNRLEELGDGVFTSLFEMYMRDGRPQKVVDMVRQTVEEGYRIKRSVVNFWGMSVRKAGFRNEAKQIDIAIGERKGRRRLQPWKKQEARALGAAMRGRESS